MPFLFSTIILHFWFFLFSFCFVDLVFAVGILFDIYVFSYYSLVFVFPVQLWFRRLWFLLYIRNTIMIIICSPFFSDFFPCKTILHTLFSTQFICISSQFLFPFLKQFFVALHFKCIMIHVILLIISIVDVWIYIVGVIVFILSFNIYNAFIIFSQNRAF